jgi:hypothetical protein
MAGAKADLHTEIECGARFVVAAEIEVDSARRHSLRIESEVAIEKRRQQ